MPFNESFVGMKNTRRYFVGRKARQGKYEFERLVDELSRVSGVEILARGRSTVEVHIEKSAFDEVVERFGSACHIEQPIDTEPAYWSKDDSPRVMGASLCYFAPIIQE